MSNMYPCVNIHHNTKRRRHLQLDILVTKNLLVLKCITSNKSRNWGAPDHNLAEVYATMSDDIHKIDDFATLDWFLDKEPRFAELQEGRIVRFLRHSDPILVESTKFVMRRNLWETVRLKVYKPLPNFETWIDLLRLQSEGRKVRIESNTVISCHELEIANEMYLQDLYDKIYDVLLDENVVEDVFSYLNIDHVLPQMKRTRTGKRKRINDMKKRKRMMCSTQAVG